MGKCASHVPIFAKQSKQVATSKDMNDIQYLDFLGKQLSFKSMDDWYNITWQNFEEYKGISRLAKYDYSPSKMLLAVYHQYSWLPWKFSSAPPDFWGELSHQRQYLEWLGKQFNFTSLDNYYSITREQLVAYGTSVSGSALLTGKKLWTNVIPCLLSKTFPEFEWLPWRFLHFSGRWETVQSQRRFVDWIGKQLEIKNWQDWYNVKSEQVTSTPGGSTLLHHHGNSLCSLLQHVYPQQKWLEWKFGRVSNGFWNTVRNQREYIDSVIHDNKWISPEETWYKTRQIIEQHHGAGLMSVHNNSLQNALYQCYPELNWSELMDQPNHNKGSQYENVLLDVLEQLFPNQKVLRHYKYPLLIHPGTGNTLELDLYYPDLQLAFEFQGEQHYNSSFFRGVFEVQQDRDCQKRQACEQFNITLIIVPYWWDQSTSSLAATISNHKPSLFKQLMPNPTIFSKERQNAEHCTPTISLYLQTTGA